MLAISIIWGVIVGFLVYSLLYGYVATYCRERLPRVWFVWEDADEAIEEYNRSDFITNFNPPLGKFVAPEVGETWSHKADGYFPAGRKARIVQIGYQDETSPRPTT